MKKLLTILSLLSVGMGLAMAQTAPAQKSLSLEAGMLTFQRYRAESGPVRLQCASAATDDKDAALRLYQLLSEGQKTVVSAPADAPVRSRSAKAAVNPPYKCSFDYKQAFENEWVTHDGDGDQNTWTYGTSVFFPTFDGGDESGYAMAQYNRKDATEDYLITKSPIRLSRGPIYVAFHHASLGEEYREYLQVYYSESPEPDLDKMHLIGDLVDSTENWKFTIMTADIPADGEYYFCFLHASDADQFCQMVDNIEIGENEFVGTPDLQLAQVVLPLSSCGLNDREEVGLKLKNLGTAGVTKFTASYQVDGGAAVTEEFTLNIPAGEVETVYFKVPADFSGEGKTYKVSAEVTVLESAGHDETIVNNNKNENTVSHFTPFTGLPVDVLFSRAANLANIGYNADVWNYDENYGMLYASAYEPVVLRCMALEADRSYRFSLLYMAGMSVMNLFVMTDGFEILCGPSGTPMDDWTVVASYEDQYTANAMVWTEATFECKTAGNYSFAVRPTAGETFLIGGMRVEAVLEHDLRFSFISPGIGVWTPAAHAVKPQFNVEIVNRGANEATQVQVKVRQGETEVGSSEIVTLAADDTAFLVFGGVLPRQAVNTDVTLTFELTMAEEDENPSDNKRQWTFTATEDIYAFDDVTKDSYEDGIGTGAFSFGNIFALEVADTLKSVVLGFFDLSEAEEYTEDFPVAMDIYALSASGEIRRKILETEFVRQLEGGLQTVDIEPQALQAGSYLIALRQLSTLNVVLGCDDNPDGLCYAVYQNQIIPMVGYGYLGIRAVLSRSSVLSNESNRTACVAAYPNPVSGLWTVAADGQTIRRVEIYSITGECVYRSADRLSAGIHQVDMAGLTPGLYVARVYTASGEQMLKVTVK